MNQIFLVIFQFEESGFFLGFQKLDQLFEKLKSVWRIWHAF